MKQKCIKRLINIYLFQRRIFLTSGIVMICGMVQKTLERNWLQLVILKIV